MPANAFDVDLDFGERAFVVELAGTGASVYGRSTAVVSQDELHDRIVQHLARIPMRRMPTEG